MPRSFNRHQFAYPSGVDNSEPRLGYRDIDKEGGVDALLHPAVKANAYLPPHVQPGFEEAGGRVLSAPKPHVAFGYDQRSSDIGPGQAQRDYEKAKQMAAAEGGEMAYDTGTGQGATPIYVRDYQRDGRDVGAGYLNNPFDEEGRERIGQQFWEAPLGGHVRGALEGQELFGHRVTGGQARMAEQGLAGLTAVGIGVPTFLAAVNQLSTPPDQGAIPL
jgi:hypothetical protein